MNFLLFAMVLITPAALWGRVRLTLRGTLGVGLLEEHWPTQAEDEGGILPILAAGPGLLIRLSPAITLRADVQKFLSWSRVSVGLQLQF